MSSDSTVRLPSFILLQSVGPIVAFALIKRCNSGSFRMASFTAIGVLLIASVVQRQINRLSLVSSVARSCAVFIHHMNDSYSIMGLIDSVCRYLTSSEVQFLLTVLLVALTAIFLLQVFSCKVALQFSFAYIVWDLDISLLACSLFVVVIGAKWSSSLPFGKGMIVVFSVLMLRSNFPHRSSTIFGVYWISYCFCKVIMLMTSSSAYSWTYKLFCLCPEDRGLSGFTAGITLLRLASEKSWNSHDYISGK